MMPRGVFWSFPEPFSSPPRPILRPGRFLVMWALCCFSPATEIANPRLVERCPILNMASSDSMVVRSRSSRQPSSPSLPAWHPSSAPARRQSRQRGSRAACDGTPTCPAHHPRSRGNSGSAPQQQRSWVGGKARRRQRPCAAEPPSQCGLLRGAYYEAKDHHAAPRYRRDS